MTCLHRLSGFLPAFLCSLVLASTASAEEAAWQTDFPAAQAKAKAEKKLLLVDFTGSDWCIWCKKLKAEVFEKDPFATEAAKQFVLVELDFPHEKKLPDELKQQNDKLAKKYKIRGFPTILILNPEGELIAHTGYRPGGAENYTKFLAELLKIYESLPGLREQMAKAEGLDRAKLLDQLIEAYDKLGNEINDIAGWRKEIIVLDPDNKAGLKVKYQYRDLMAEVARLKTARKLDEVQAAVAKILELPGLTGAQKQDAYIAGLDLSANHEGPSGAVATLKKALDAAPESPKAAAIKAVLQRLEAQAKAKAAADAVADKAKAEGKSDPSKVPDGTPEELFAYIEGLKQGPAEAPKDFSARMELTRKITAATVEAVEKILAAKPTKEQTAKALKIELAALSSQPIYSIDAKTLTKLEQLVGQLEKADLPKEARDAKRAYLTCKVSSVGNRPEELEKVVGQIKDFFASGPADPGWGHLAMTACQSLERSGKTAMAAKSYRELGKILASKGDKSLADTALMLEGAARRIELPEHAMVVEGITLDGKPLDWGQYSGKVVLVDFWATWCGPCRAELPNVKKAYETYHDRGFEVVGISLDTSREALDKFMEKEKLPWTIVLDDSWNKKGSAASEGSTDADGAKPAPRALARYYGVFAIPTAILLGKDGKAVSLNARGATLTRELEKLLGPADGKKE